jgi:hypothetical protein
VDPLSKAADSPTSRSGRPQPDSLPARAVMWWLSAFVSTRTWPALAYLLTGLPLGTAASGVGLLGVGLGIGLLPLALLGLPLLSGTLLAVGGQGSAVR